MEECRLEQEIAHKDITPNIAWYQRTGILVLAFLTVGPLVLPLVWTHPRLSVTQKWMVTMTVIVITVVLVFVTMRSMKVLWQSYQDILNQM